MDYQGFLEEMSRVTPSSFYGLFFTEIKPPSLIITPTILLKRKTPYPTNICQQWETLLFVMILIDFTRQSVLLLYFYKYLLSLYDDGEHGYFGGGGA